MGNGSSRSGKDSVVIKPPKKGSGSEGGGGGQQEGQKLPTCPLSFKETLAKSVSFKDGTKVGLVTENDLLVMYAGVIKIGSLSKSKSHQIGECLKLGFKYHGLVKTEPNGAAHVEFKRSK